MPRPCSGDEPFPRCRPVGDRHLVLEFGEGIDEDLNLLVYRTERILLASGAPGILETTPAYSSLLVRLDPTLLGYGPATRLCLTAARAASGQARVRAASGPDSPEAAGVADPLSADVSGEVVVPVVYGGEWGPDLGDVARHTGLPAAEIIRRHASGRYRVYMVGFAPGFPYLGGMDPALATPRLAVARPRVPAGSVGIAGAQTGVYPQELPGGWRIIGRTPLRVWRPENDEEPCLLAPGRRVRFVNAGPGEVGWREALAMASGAVSGAVREDASPGRYRARFGSSGRVGADGGAGPEGPSTGPGSPAPVAVVRRPGPLTTVQDGGRWGYSRLGVPESGALDPPALAAANRAVGNPPAAAGLEVTFGGLELEFLGRAIVAVSPGAGAELDGRRLEEGRAVPVAEGARLSFGRGSWPRAYLALAGGVACPVVLGSRSTYLAASLGGYEGRALRSGDVIHAGPHRTEAPLSVAPPASAPDRAGGALAAPGRGDDLLEVPGSAGVTRVRVVPGPQDHLFEEAAHELFYSSDWRVLEASDRRACLLEGPRLPAPDGAGLSDGTPAGSVQVPPSGKPIVLLADHQTTGGYAKIATVVSADLPLLGRAWPGSVVRFTPVRPEALLSAAASLEARTSQTVVRGSAVEAPPEKNSGRARGAVVRLEFAGRVHLVSIRPSVRA